MAPTVLYTTENYKAETLGKVKSYETLHSGQRGTPLGGRYTSVKSFGSGSDMNNRKAIPSSRSTKLLSAGLKFKSNYANKTQFFGHDRVYDSVAESLFRIHDRLNRTNLRRNDRI